MKRQQDIALAGVVWTDQRADVPEREVQRLYRPKVLDSDSADSHGGAPAACRILVVWMGRCSETGLPAGSGAVERILRTGAGGDDPLVIVSSLPAK